ncbi:ethionine resistance protein [Coemansia sp. RSA 988]|nr:ethionine resistance protein [Coemansia sp. RSA 988]
MADVATDTEAGVARNNLDDSAPLLHMSPSQADIEIIKRDTRDPYFAVALKEFRWMSSSTFWTALALLLQSFIPFINAVSMGHLGATELAAMTLSTTCYGVVALAPSIGMMGAMETFCSNAYTASRDKTMVGVHFQR